MKKIVFLLVFFLSGISFGQENYKYVVMPKKFSFFKEENRFNLNTITKSFFENQGFEVYFDNDVLPKELSENRCLALYVVAFEENSLFLTKNYFEVKDCSNNILIKSDLGTSREKEYKKAYNETFGKALNSIKNKLDLKRSNSKEIIIIDSEKKVLDESHNLNYNLFAIPTATGYKLVNDKPETIFILYKTSDNDVFTAVKGNLNGVLIKKNNYWFFEYYQEEKLISEKVEVKF